MKQDELRHNTLDRVELRGRIWSPDEGQSARGVVQIVHGMAEHGGRYKRLAGELTQAGYIVYAQDLRGHGRTAGTLEKLGHFADLDGWQLVLSDVSDINQLIHRSHPGLPVALLGHSLGSFIAQHYLSLYGGTLACCALSATDYSTGPLRRIALVLADFEALRMGVRGRSRLLQKLFFGGFNKPFEPARTAYDWLSRDPEEVDKYVKDPYCGFECSAAAWTDVLTGLGSIRSREARARIPTNLPIYLFAGARDPVGRFGKGPKKLQLVYLQAGIQDVDLRLYPETRHEPFNEINRDEITQDFIEWLNSRMPSPGSIAEPAAT